MEEVKPALRFWRKEKLKGGIYVYFNIGYGIFGLSGLRHKDEDPSFFYSILTVCGKVLPKPLMEEIKVVFMQGYEFENLDEFFDQVFVFTSRSRIGSETKVRFNGLVLGSRHELLKDQPNCTIAF